MNDERKVTPLRGLEFVEHPEPMLRDSLGCVLKPGMFHRASLSEIVHRCETYPALVAALEGGRQKLATYQGIYSGDKELRRLLSEWDALLQSSKEHGNG